jgi:hypothetical protein
MIKVRLAAPNHAGKLIAKALNPAAVAARAALHPYLEKKD